MPDQPNIQHWIMFSDLANTPSSQPITISDQEAHHAVRVKRVRINDQVGLLDAKGHTAIAAIQSIEGSKSKPTLTLTISSTAFYEPQSPIIEIYAALPKGDRLDRMIDQLSQLAVTTFRPLLCDRSQRKPETIRPGKLDRIAIEATKQCHRPYKLNIDAPIHFADALKDPDVLIADASGSPFQCNTAQSRSVLLIGPEGGWSNEERAAFAATKAPIIRFGTTVLRIEAAAAAASAIALSQASAPTPINAPT